MIPRLLSVVRLTVILASVLILTSCKEDTPAETPVAEQPAVKRRDPNNYLADCRDLYNNARTLDSILQLQTEAETSIGNEAIAAFTEYAYYCNNDSLSPVYLIKSAQVGRAINNLPQAQKSLRYCIDTYRDSRHRPAAIFLLAQLHEDKTYLNDRDEAEKLYQQIIDEYPKSEWAESAKGAMAMIGMSEEEIIRFLKKKK